MNALKTKGIFYLLVLFMSPCFAQEENSLKPEAFPFSNDSAETETSSKNTPFDSSVLDKDNLSIGGTLKSKIDYQFAGDDHILSFPNNLWLYADAHFPKDIRAFASGRLIYNPSYDGTTTSQFTAKTQRRETWTLDELKLMFNIQHTLFWTVGKQKIKWGASHFWNPTDSLNQTKKDFFQSTDERGGLPLIKTNIPLSFANIYGIALLDNATELNQMSWVGRAEIPLPSAEMSATFITKSDEKNTYNVDGSFSLWDFDLYGELSYSKGTNDPHYKNAAPDPTYDDRDIFKASGGISYDLYYNEKDALTLNGEYFYNGNGYTNTKEYLAVLANQQYTPFYLSQNYALLALIANEPFGLTENRVSLYEIANLSDCTQVTRLQWDVTFYRKLDVQAALSGHTGKSGGEFTIFDQYVDASLRAKVDF